MSMSVGSKRVVCIIPAAGAGLRFGSSVRKQYLLLDGRTVLDHTLSHVAEISWLDEICLVLPESDLETAKTQYTDAKSSRAVPIKVVAGGETRQESVYNGLRSYASDLSDADYVLVHDGVRPFFPLSSTAAIQKHVEQGRAFVTAIEVTDTIKEVDRNNEISRTLERRTLRQIQTPQGAPFKSLLNAHQRAAQDRLDVTDDASLLEMTGEKVFAIEGTRDNIKITAPTDWEFARVIYERIKHENRTRI